MFAFDFGFSLTTRVSALLRFYTLFPGEILGLTSSALILSLTTNVSALLRFYTLFTGELFPVFSGFYCPSFKETLLACTSFFFASSDYFFLLAASLTISR